MSVAVPSTLEQIRTQGVTGVDEEEEYRERSSLPERPLQIGLARLVNRLVEHLRQLLLRAKRLRSADSRNDLLSDAACVGHVLQGQPAGT